MVLVAVPYPSGRSIGSAVGSIRTSTGVENRSLAILAAGCDGIGGRRVDDELAAWCRDRLRAEPEAVPFRAGLEVAVGA